jgi:hypothetical protein
MNEQSGTDGAQPGAQSEEKMENYLELQSLGDTSANLFYKALAAGRNHKFFGKLTRRPSCLMDLGSYHSHSWNGHYAGEQEVALDDIRGTEGRQNDFDDRFHPLTEHSRQRWQSVARAFEAGIDLPPVELIRVGEVYFVRDGHHRISVARALGLTTIMARVTAW